MNLRAAKKQLDALSATRPPVVTLSMSIPWSKKTRQQLIADLSQYMAGKGYRLDGVIGLPGQSLVFRRDDN